MDELIRKQDAIEAINLWLYCDKDERMPADVIKALPTVYVPDMNVGDMISRQAAIDLLKQMRKDGDMVPWEGKDVFARIRKLPSAQPKRKTGYKINQHQYPEKWVCSECGAKHFDFSDNFCSQCGADVRGEQDE